MRFKNIEPVANLLNAAFQVDKSIPFSALDSI
jgi:hypothetical protein